MGTSHASGVAICLWSVFMLQIAVRPTSKILSMLNCDPEDIHLVDRGQGVSAHKIAHRIITTTG
jgi:hypothetical protein